MEVLHAERYLSNKGTTQQMNILKLTLSLSTVPLAMNWGVWELGPQIPEHYHYGFTSRNAPTLEVLHHKSSIQIKFGRRLTVHILRNL